MILLFGGQIKKLESLLGGNPFIYLKIKTQENGMCGNNKF